MNRAELVERIASAHDTTKAAADRIIDTVFQSIIDAVKKGEGFSLVGFGTFKLGQRGARTGRNPQTGEEVKIAARKVPKFTAGTAFKSAVDPKAAARRAEKAGGAKKAAPAKKAAAKKPVGRK